MAGWIVVYATLFKRTIGITGRTGFIGWHLLERLGRDPSFRVVELRDQDYIGKGTEDRLPLSQELT